MLREVIDKSSLDRNLRQLEQLRAFLSDGQAVINDIKARPVVSGIAGTILQRGEVSSCHEISNSFASLVYKYTLDLSTAKGTDTVQLYIKAHLPFLKGAPNYAFEPSFQGRGKREARALTDLAALQLPSLCVPQVVAYDQTLRLLIMFAIDRIEDASGLDPAKDYRGELSQLVGQTLARMHSSTYTGKVASSREALIADSVLRFRSTPLQVLADADQTFHDLWLSFVRDTRSRYVCQVHGDLSPRNVLALDGSKLILFDLDLSSTGDPASDLGFFLGHYYLTMLRDSKEAQGLQKRVLVFWKAYLSNAANTVIGDVLQLEIRMIKYAGVTLLYRAWFEPAWRLTSPGLRQRVYDFGLRLFEMGSLAKTFQLSLPI